MSDVLFDLRSYFLLGNYQTAINEGTKATVQDEATKIQRDVYLFRCYIEQGNYQLVLEEIKSTSPPDLKAVRLLALYFLDSEKGTQQLHQYFKEEQMANNLTFQYIASLIHFNNGNLEDALRCSYANNSLDGRAFVVQIYLSMQRVDLAEKELNAMQSLGDDAIQTQLAAAWIAIAQGGEKFQEALDIYQELIDKYGQSVPLLNGVAIASINLNKLPDAERALLDALEKNPNSPETLVNLVVCYQHMKKPPEILRRYLNQLRQVAPSHPWVQSLAKADMSFDTNSARFSI
eukprot:TRINITY_DN6067_c0_g1_i1.p1 TRINITY_DN6067_c0_g1~~TRINITY_DN6067_c0_g1_i1.p1  ORF type:complete len:290 (-),score=49.32 TRINITY_DN6067_c0_g1_i1:99-968(-)